MISETMGVPEIMWGGSIVTEGDRQGSEPEPGDAATIEGHREEMGGRKEENHRVGSY